MLLPSVPVVQLTAGAERPKIQYEQYPTSAHLAARVLHVAQETFDDIEGRVVADFGCGCGILGIGASLLGAWYAHCG